MMRRKKLEIQDNISIFLIYFQGLFYHLYIVLLLKISNAYITHSCAYSYNNKKICYFVIYIQLICLWFCIYIKDENSITISIFFQDTLGPFFLINIYGSVSYRLPSIQHHNIGSSLKITSILAMECNVNVWI